MSYLDCNALYSAAFWTPLPNKNFRVLNNKERKELLQGNIYTFINSLDVNGPKGYLLQVNLTIPEHLHPYFHDLPPAVEMKTIQKDQISDYQMNFKEELKENDSIFTTTRLIADINPKHDYVIHSRTSSSLYEELSLHESMISKKNFIQLFLNWYKCNAVKRSNWKP